MAIAGAISTGISAGIMIGGYFAPALLRFKEPALCLLVGSLIIAVSSGAVAIFTDMRLQEKSRVCRGIHAVVCCDDSLPVSTRVECDEENPQCSEAKKLPPDIISGNKPFSG